MKIDDELSFLTLGLTFFFGIILLSQYSLCSCDRIKERKIIIMREKRRVFRKVLAVFFAAVMALASALPSPMEVRAAGTIKSKTVKAGKTVTLKVKKTSKKVKWSVNKPSIAKIVKTKGRKKETAVVKGLKVGKAVVTARIGKKKQSVTITVKTSHVHSYTTPATCTEPAKCSCGRTFGTPLGHQMAPATCQSPQKCIRCGAATGDPVPHSFSPDTHRCSWCGLLNLKDFVGFRLSHTANTGNYNVNFIYLAVANIGNVSFEILTSMPATVYPSAGAPGIRVYLTNENDETYTDANKFVVLPSSAGEAWFDTLSSSNTFTFTPDGMVEFYASYGEHVYLFRVNASKLNSQQEILLADYTFTYIR